MGQENIKNTRVTIDHRSNGGTNSFNSVNRFPVDLLGHLITLIYVAEGKGFSSAARALGKTPSAISRSMTQLEDRLQTKIFVRSRQSVRLTLAGEEIFLSCKAMHLAAAHVFDVCREQQQTLSGSLKIAGPKTLMKVVVAPIVCQFLKRYPSVEARILADDRDFSLVNEQIDLLFKIESSSASRKNARLLGEVSYVLCASHRYLRQYGAVSEPVDLLSHRCMHFGETSKDSIWVLRKHGSATELRVEDEFCINHSEALLDAALADTGVALLPNFVAMPAIADHKLLHVLPDYEIDWPHRGSLYLESAFGPNVPQRVAAFVTYLLQSAELDRFILPNKIRTQTD